jgi:universal stress protein A
MLPITKILCPTDFSEPSLKALKVANDLAIHFNAELILIHVLSPVYVYPSEAIPGILKTSSVEEIDREELANNSLSNTLKERVSDEIKSRSILGKGNPAEEIANNAKKEKVDMIVIGTHGFTGWRHLILGSVAEKVVRFASCPVLTIPAHNVPVAM